MGEPMVDLLDTMDTVDTVGSVDMGDMDTVDTVEKDLLILNLNMRKVKAPILMLLSLHIMDTPKWPKLMDILMVDISPRAMDTLDTAPLVDSLDITINEMFLKCPSKFLQDQVTRSSSIWLRFL